MGDVPLYFVLYSVVLYFVDYFRFCCRCADLLATHIPVVSRSNSQPRSTSVLGFEVLHWQTAAGIPYRNRSGVQEHSSLSTVVSSATATLVVVVVSRSTAVTVVLVVYSSVHFC